MIIIWYSIVLILDVISLNYRKTMIKYSNWIDFKIGAMELFMHNPQKFRFNIQYAEHKQGITACCTDDDIHIEFYTTHHDDLKKVDQLSQWFVEKMASSLEDEQFIQLIKEDIEKEKAKKQSN